MDNDSVFCFSNRCKRCVCPGDPHLGFGSGDDANPCSRTAPCKTFAGAISKTAAKGEISVLDPGGFGAVSITKPITINGSGGSIAGVLAAGVNGITVNVNTGTYPNAAVILLNLYIDGTGTGLNGISFTGGGNLIVENTKIYGFTQNGINFIPNATASLSVDRTIVYNTGTSANTYGGLYVKPTAGASAFVTVTGSNFSRSIGFGVKAEDGAKVMVSNSAANNNADGYIALSTAAPAEITLARSVASGNSSRGVVADGSLAVVYMTGTTVTQNGTGIVTANGGDVLSHGSNSIMGNTTDGAPTGYLPQYLGPLVIF